MTLLFSKRQLVQDDETLVSGVGAFSSLTGGKVSEATALGVAAVWAATRVISESVAMLPFHTFRRIENGKTRDRRHSVDRLLSTAPNPEMTAIEFRDALTGQAVLRGNSYANIERDANGNVVALWPLRTDRMRIERRNGQLRYIYNVDGRDRLLFPDEVLHIKGFSPDGWVGYDSLRVQRDTFGNVIAAQDSSTRWYGNDSSPGGAIVHPGRLPDEARNNMKESWEKAHRGLKRSHRVAILEEGVKWQSIGVDPQQSQLLETRQFNVSEVARIFRVPNHMINDLSRATFSNIEQQSIDFVTHSLQPWLTRWEQAVNVTLFTRSEQNTLFAEHSVQALLRGDAAARASFYNQGFNNGWLSPDEIRAFENLNPQPDGIGDVYARPLNVTFVGGGSDSVDEPEPETEPEPEANERKLREKRRREFRTARDRNRLQQSMRSAFAAAAQSVVNREASDIKRQVDKELRDTAAFRKWLDEFFEDHRQFIRRRMLPVFRSLAEQSAIDAARELDADIELGPEFDEFLDQYMTTFENRHIGSSRGQIDAIIRDAEPGETADDLDERLDEWTEKRADKIASRETVQLGNAAVVETFLFLGITAWRWVTIDDNCPACQSLDGEIVNQSTAFFQAGESVKGENGEPIKLRSKVKHPPIHRGCDCTVIAG